MTLIVACPNCQTRYNLPDKFQGKKVKCKSCGKPFAAAVGAGRAAGEQVNQQAQGVAQIDAQELSKMGIGELRKQADPFATPAYHGPDPLRNHVVQDPGFGMGGVPGMAPGMPSHAADDAEGVDAEYQVVVANPYVKEAPKSSGHGAVEEAPASSGKSRKKRKKKVHPAVKDSLDKATMTLLIVGVLIAMLFGFFFISAYSDAMADMKNINVLSGEKIYAEADMPELAAQTAYEERIFHGVGISIGVWFMLLGLGVQFFPITCSVIGLISYILFELVFCFVMMDFFRISGWVRRFLVCSALVKSFMDAVNARAHEKNMAERRASGR